MVGFGFVGFGFVGFGFVGWLVGFGFVGFGFVGWLVLLVVCRHDICHKHHKQCFCKIFSAVGKISYDEFLCYSKDICADFGRVGIVK